MLKRKVFNPDHREFSKCMWMFHLLIIVFAVINARVYSQPPQPQPDEKKDTNTLLDNLLSHEEKEALMEWPIVARQNAGRSNAMFSKGELEKMFLERMNFAVILDREFLELNLIRAAAHKFELVWYKNDLKKEKIKDHIYDEKEMFSHRIEQPNEIDQWQEAFSSQILRFNFGANRIGGFGGISFPPNGIKLIAHKKTIFIGITPVGFYLGNWTENNFHSERLFYSPELAIFLKKYVDSQQLEYYPSLDITMLSGQNRFNDIICFESLNDRNVLQIFGCETYAENTCGEARAVINVLKARFKEVPKSLANRISKIDNIVLLDSLTELAATCKSLDEFSKSLMGTSKNCLKL